MMKTGDVLAAAALVFALALAGCGSGPAAPRAAVVPADAMADPARGELLYRTACADCHSKETHWLGRHKVTDWQSLIEQVTHWQGVAGQTWGLEEIEDVAAYLNRRFYNVPCPLPRCAAGTVGLRGNHEAQELQTVADPARGLRSLGERARVGML